MKWAHQSYFKDVPYEQNKYAKEGDKIHKALEFRLRDKIRLPRVVRRVREICQDS